MNTPVQEHVCYDLLSSFERGIREYPQKEADTSDQKNLEINLADKIEALLEDYPACDALIRFSSYLDAEVERYRNRNNESRKEIVENVVKALHRQIKGDNSLVAAMLAARNHDKKCRELARKDWLNHVDFMTLIGILDGFKSLELDEAKIEDKQYLVESFKKRLPSEKLILLNESPAFPCTPMELADWFEQIKLPLNKIIPSFVDELAAIEATKVKASPEPGQAKGGEEAENQKALSGKTEPSGKAETGDGKTGTLTAIGLSQQYNLPITTAEGLLTILMKAKELGINLTNLLPRGTRTNLEKECNLGDGVFRYGWQAGQCNGLINKKKKK